MGSCETSTERRTRRSLLALGTGMAAATSAKAITSCSRKFVSDQLRTWASSSNRITSATQREGLRTTASINPSSTTASSSMSASSAMLGLGMTAIAAQGLRSGVSRRWTKCISLPMNPGIKFRQPHDLSHTATGRRAVATAEAPVKVLTDEIHAPASDPRSYRVLELANGLQVLIASDRTADSSAAAMTIRAGTFQDPDERPGLAHFHEHMLFLGTEKYPKEDEYSRFLSEHGGDSNAFTMSEYTTYYFKVASPHLDGALDRFAQFFVSPTFNPSCVEREMNAVDSESTNYSTEDAWRLMQVLKASAAEEHPFYRFDVGNLETLGSDDSAKTRETLIEWNRTHYQGAAMRLVVLGRDNLEDLQQSVISKFGAVREGPGSEQSYPCKPWPSKKVGRIISCVPLKEARSISACWPLPPVTDHLFGKPELYLAHMIGHEGPGSLHAVLNQFGWVDQLSAGSSYSFADEQLFAVNISLTPEGDAHRPEVLALLFEYVELIQKTGPQDEVFKELAALQEISFAHKEDTPAPDDFAASAAMALHKYPVNEVLRGPFALDEWKPEVISEYLATITPERSLIFLTSDAFVAESNAGDAADQGWKRETWYKAPYKEEPITSEKLSSWKEALNESLEGQPSGLALPAANEFIPEDFSLRTPSPHVSTSKLPMEVTPPQPLVSDSMLRVWHKTDAAFKTPREYVLGHVHTGAYEMGPATVAMTRLFCNVVIDDLNTFSYDATVAGLGFSLEFSDNLSMSVGGFSDKLPKLLEVVVARLGLVLDAAAAAAKASEDATSEEELFEALGERGQELLEKMEVARQILLQDYKNFTREEPWSVSSYYSSQLMLMNSWHLNDYIEVLENPPSLSTLVAEVRKAFSKVQVDLLVHGNVTSDEAKSIGEQIRDAFKSLGAGVLPEIRRKKITQLPTGATTIFEYNLATENPAQENCCTQNIYEVGPTNVDLHRDACVSLMCHIAGPSCYQKLRTEEQLGYIVQASTWVECYVCGLAVLVQGNRLTPRQVDERIEAWIEGFGQELEKMSEEEFQNNVKAVVSERTQRNSRLMQETGRHWAEILPRRYKFDRLADTVKALESLKKEDVQGFFNEYISATALSRRKLSVRILGTSADDDSSQSTGPNDILLKSIEDIRTFQATSSFYSQPPPSEMPAIQ